MFNKKQLVIAVSCALTSSLALADKTTVEGPMAFDPIAETVVIGSLPANAPLSIPEGFRQYIVSDESNLDIYPGLADWPDMNTVNESKKYAGKFLYRTHEVRTFLFNDDVEKFKAAGGGAVSVVNLESGEAKVLVQREDWEALDGLVWTPWHTLLFAEEANSFFGPVIIDPDVPNATNGLLYEIKLDSKNPMKAKKVMARPMLGSLSHEGIETDSKGNVYVIDEDSKGSIYKFVPDTYGDLSSGQLYALKVDDGVSGNGTGRAEWVALNMDQVQISARVAATTAGATQYGRPEDLERIGNTLYVALTSSARVLSISLEDKVMVKEFVKAGINAPVEGAGVTGFNKPDNLASGPAGNLWIVEDNKPSDIWVATPDDNNDGYADGVHLFASLSTKGAEASGIYFGHDPKTLLVNVQHSADGNDMTLAVTNREVEKEEEEEDN